MQNCITNISFVSLDTIGYNNNYSITEDGRIVSNANFQPVEANKKGQYKLHTKEGKRVIKTKKTLYKQAFNKEYAEDNIVNLDGEIWKAIDNKGRYYVSNMGRVKSLCKSKAKILKPFQNQQGYLRVDINTNKRKTKLVHQLVANAFIENDNPDEKKTVNHIDGNKKNNKTSNLEWLSAVDNIRAYYNSIGVKRDGNQS